MKKATRDTTPYENYFMFGSLAGAAFDLFAREQALAGTLLTLVLATAAIYASKNDIKQEIALLRTVPEKFVLTLRDMRAAVIEYSERMQRQLRLKRVLKRNRTYRIRRLVLSSDRV